MALALRHGTYMMWRELLALWRQPWWIAVTLMQPIIWLLLFGELFRSVVEIPGFETSSYVDFLVPGVIIMTAFFGASWGGMGMIEDLDRGVTDRLLVSPLARAALVAGKVMQSAVVIVVQSLIMIGLALIIGASFPGGIDGVLVMLAMAVLLGCSVGALSNGLALYIRKEESLIALLSAVQLPLTFISTAFMQKDLIPGWMQTAADFNPLNWAIEASRTAVLEGGDWGFIAARAGLLVVVLLLSGWFALRAVAAYQRSV
ncbi:MAG TPA: ABC transporter permease [Solirubrobacterales bacterium]